MSTAHDTVQSLAFLRSWKPEGPWVLCAFNEEGENEFRTFTHEHEDQLIQWLHKQNANAFNVYFHVNSVQPNCGKASKTDVLSMDWLHVDVDPRPGQDITAEQKRILKMLQENTMLPKPTVMIFSGGGYQAFWRLAEPIAINRSEKRCEEAERWNEQIQILLRADACHNADRIMRLPGTINFPNEKKRKRGQEPVMARVVSGEDWGEPYDLDKFTQAPARMGKGAELPGSANQIKVVVSDNLPRLAPDALESDPMFAAVSSRAKVAIVQGFDEDQPLTGDNSRSEWLFYVVCELARNEVPDEVIYSIITDPDFKVSASVLDKGNPSSVKRYALRQIQRAKENADEPWLERLNREYAYIESVGGKARIACERFNEANGRFEIEFHLKDGFLGMWNNKPPIPVMSGQDAQGNPKLKMVPPGDWWMRHQNRREYRDVVFYPNREFGESLNLWRGFAYDAVPGDCSLFLDHTENVICRGNEEHYSYLIKWMANAVQNPHLAGQVAIALRGGQGTGKGTFVKGFGKLFGAHFKHVTNPDHVTGQFNGMLKDAVVVLADECFVANSVKHEAALKALITEETVRTEQKNLESMESRNCVHLLMATNAEWVVSAALDDRRFFILSIDDSRQVDTKYFGKLQAQMENGGYEALMHFLLNYDLTGFDGFDSCPKTAELRHQQEQSLEPKMEFWLHILEDGRLMPTHGGWNHRVYKRALCERFKDIYPHIRKNMAMALGKFLSKVAHVRADIQTGGGRWVDGRGQSQTENNGRVWVFPPLAECRRLWEQETKSGTRDWPEEPDDADAGTYDELPEDGGGEF